MDVVIYHVHYVLTLKNSCNKIQTKPQTELQLFKMDVRIHTNLATNMKLWNCNNDLINIVKNYSPRVKR